MNHEHDHEHDHDHDHDHGPQVTATPSPTSPYGPWIVDPDAPPLLPQPPRELPHVPPWALLRPADDVLWAPVGDEVVVYRAADAHSWVLNNVAGLVWQCLDGESAVGEILDDVAKAFGVEPEQVREDFGPVLGEWVADGLAGTVDDPLAPVAWPPVPELLAEPPNDCGQALRSMWPHNIVIVVGRSAMTVASDVPEFVESLTPWETNDDTDLVHFVFDTDPPGRGGHLNMRHFPSVRHGSCALFRLRDLGLLETAMRRTLASFEVVETPGQLRVGLMPLLRDGRALLVPPFHAGSMSHRWYEGQGIEPLYTASCVLDVASWTVRVDDPLGVPSDGAEDRWYPVVGWWLPSDSPETGISPGHSVAHVLRLAVGVAPSRAAETLATVAEAVRTHQPELAPVVADRIIERVDPATANELRQAFMMALLWRFEEG